MIDLATLFAIVPVPASGPTPWLAFIVEAVGAVGSAGAAIVAVYLAYRSSVSAAESRAEARQLRERERRSQALRFIASATSTKVIMDGTADLPTPERLSAVWTVDLRNASDAPIYDVGGNVRISSGGHSDALQGVPLIGPLDTVATYSAENVLILDAEPVLTLWFRDSAGVWWLRDEEGVLTEQDGPGTPLSTPAMVAP